MVKIILIFFWCLLFSSKLYAPIILQNTNQSFDYIEEIYLEGLQKFRTKNYSDSQQLFTAFLKEDPNHDLAGEVQYWLGQSYFDNKEFEKAKIEFDLYLKNYVINDDSSKFPEYLYNYSSILHFLSQDTVLKCYNLNKLINSFPKHNLTLRAKIDINAYECNNLIGIGDKKISKQELDKNKPPFPIAITNFYSSSTLYKYGKNISNVISNNLERSGDFTIIDQKSFIQSSEPVSKQPRFKDWKIIKSRYLVSGEINENGNKISVIFRLYDVLSQKQLLGKKYETSEENWRRVSHIISDQIYEIIMGMNAGRIEGKSTSTKGHFDTRIIYVAETGPNERKQKRLAIMDQDQANHRFLTDGRYLVLSPSFSPNSQKIVYVSYVNKNNPRVYIFDIETGQQEIVGEFPGMTFDPRFSPDGNEIIMSYADPHIGNSEIYILDLQTRVSRKITNSSGIDISPSFSPDGKNIVFNSDRAGRRHLYIKDLSSTNNQPQRISKEIGSYYSPVWSPMGDLIAFTKQQGGKFYIGVMNTDGSNERIITKAFHVEGPTWSPNGKHLMYYKTERVAVDGSGGESSLYSIDITGYNERKIITPLGASQPSWSRLMH